MAFTEDTRRYREFKLGDLVHFHESYVIPPDAVNWKLDKPDTTDSLAIIFEEDVGIGQKFSNYKLYRIRHIKSGIVRTCSAHNLTKAYISDELRK